MIKTLDPQFAKIVRLMRSTTFAAERATARAKAMALAKAAGLTLKQALAQFDRDYDEPPPGAPPPRSPFTGFEDWQEQQNPGYKARAAAERAEKFRAWQIRKAELVRRYGSEEAALAPCDRELEIRRAVQAWQIFSPWPDQRWTETLGGMRSAYDKAPPHIIAAIRSAYAFPQTFAQARAEAAYWNRRSQEMEDLLRVDGQILRDETLDLPAQIRFGMVRALAERDIRLDNLSDLVTRSEMYRERQCHDPEMVDAILRDLEAIAEAKKRRPSASVHDIRMRVMSELEGNPSASDREIARVLGCSPTTVGKVRRSTGKTSTKRSVRRGRQTYDFKVAR